MASGVWHLAYGIWHMAYGVWHLVFGIWRLASGDGLAGSRCLVMVWQVAGVWLLRFGVQQVSSILRARQQVSELLTNWALSVWRGACAAQYVDAP